MSNFAFCTLTVGEEYRKFSKTLIKQVTDLGHKIFVMTDIPSYYETHENVVIIPYTKKYFSFHEKRNIVRECLKHYETAIFLDADVVLKDINDLSFMENIHNGLHIFASFGNIGFTFFDKHYNEAFDIVKKYNYKCKKQFHKEVPGEYYLEHFLEGKWILKKDGGKENDFLDIWDKLADFCENSTIEKQKTERIGSEEGAAMSIACHNSGIKFSIAGPLTTFMTIHFISNYEEKMNGTLPWNIAG